MIKSQTTKKNSQKNNKNQLRYFVRFLGKNPREPWRGRSNFRCDMASVTRGENGDDLGASSTGPPQNSQSMSGVCQSSTKKSNFNLACIIEVDGLYGLSFEFSSIKKKLFDRPLHKGSTNLYIRFALPVNSSGKGGKCQQYDHATSS